MAEKTRTISGSGEGESEIVFSDVGNFQSDNNSIMNASQISTASSECVIGGQIKANLNITHNIGGGYCRFPKLEECAHFHYERVQLGRITIRLIEDKSDLQSSNASQHDGTSQMLTGWFIMKVSGEKSDPFLIRRSIDNVKMLDEMLHRCVYDRKISGLKDLSTLDLSSADSQIETIVASYLGRFSSIVSDSLTCGPILTWFQLDNKGRRLPLADMDTMKSINTPAVGAAYGIRKYTAQACDEISIDVGDMISVIDMPSPAESTWWRGKKNNMQKNHYEVGFFPQSCVATIGDKVPRHLVLPAPLVGSLAVSPTKPVLRKHGKLIAFFRSFILSRPSRRRLKQSGIYKERVFSCDLSEHLLNSGQDIPMVLKCCAEFIEEHGIVDGIYRLSGITSNIQKLRRGFDEERVPDLSHPEIRQDIHALSSLLKMYFRELPNPLCTYQLYDHFVDAIQTRGDTNERLRLMKETVQKLPPPHYRTLKYLATHLNRISHHSANTGMTDRNLAIVWAPNLLRSPALELGGVAALRGVGVQAVVTEYLITNCNLIFDPNDDIERYESLQCDSFTDTESLQIEQREHHDHSLFIERPKSLSVGGPRLISLEEAQTRHNRLEFIDVNKSHPINTPSGCSTYIEVGGGPSSLPDKYHTVLPVPRSWQKRKTHSWKSLFSRNARNSNSNQDIKNLNSITPTSKEEHTTVSSPYQEDAVKHISLRGNPEKIVKSVDIYDGKPMEICVRSNSIDSLRTAGHSRSVSHDSYFDLLQSPLRVNATTCGSRELSELGINFDREEPEMRIFSESESLVSSPRIAKETNRRVMTRSRPDDYSNQSNNIIPSPKKQPRLNLQSPNATARWSTNGHSLNNEESVCKRYKLEDQLSDIQFIDCSTPEHSANNPNTIYASVQIHNPPTSSKSSDLNSDLDRNDCIVDAVFGNSKNNGGIKSRYSYPGMKVNETGEKQESEIKDERFSYPGMGKKFVDEKKFVCRVPVNDENEKNQSNIQKKVGRFSYCDANSIHRIGDKGGSVNLVLRSNSAEIIKRNELGRSKLSIATPSSPVKSPRYSLLVGDTSSENSSSINTPLYDTDMSSNGGTTTFGQKQENVTFGGESIAKESGIVLQTDVGSNICSQQQNINTEYPHDPLLLKRELSLDLDGSKMSVDDTSLSSTNKHIINVPSTPNTPNITHTSGNTSQSMTPSEFGYQHLNRQSAAVTPDISPKSTDINVYEQLEHSFGNYDTATRLSVTPKPMKSASPIKSTINITYNLKSPAQTPTHENIFFSGSLDSKNKQTNAQSDYEIVNVAMVVDGKQRKPLLETSFDENMVYEQVKFFKGAVSEVNALLDNGNDSNSGEKMLFNMDEDLCFGSDNQSTQQVVPDVDGGSGICSKNSKKFPDPEEVNSNMISCVSVESKEEKFNESFDVPMSDVDIQDSLEIEQNLSLYENVELRKPDSVYENIDLSQSKKSTEVVYENVSKPGKIIVRELANKFETSPVDAMPPFDFSKPFVKKLDNNRNSPCLIRAKNNKELHKSAKITRSLDENAFIREFGKVDKIENVNYSTQQINENSCNSGANINTNTNRRMSLEFVQPKSLNPPKRLPNLDDADTEICKYENNGTLKLDLTKVDEVVSGGSYNVKITPTTENPISLIQNNVNVSDVNADKNIDDDERNASSLSNLPNLKVLGSFKLDRERIEKIKEERRHQLNEQFRSESIKSDNEYSKGKSKSKTELRDIKNSEKPDSLRFKSKSRCDMRSLKDIGDNAQLDIVSTLGLSSTDSGLGVGRVRRISDEKNQNDCIDYISDMTKITDIRSISGDSKLATKPRKFDKKDFDFNRDRINFSPNTKVSNSRPNSQRERISPQFSIRDVAAMFESRSQNQ